MTWFEFKAMLVLRLMVLLRIKMKDLHDSYPYNPYSHSETMEAWTKVIVKPPLKRLARSATDSSAPKT